ncbi:MAG: HD domain-containing phosphohydrolase [Planctomycetota bacterium]
MSDPKPRVLCVDDERNVLDGLRRTLRQQFDVQIAPSGKAGLRELEKDAPFEVVVSDLRMPGMDGIEFLTAVREGAPDTTRVLLTGNADLSAAIAAVNEGNIFRFLSKPCPASTLIPAISGAAEQYRLVTAERVLLQKTLLGSVKMLTEVLALASPTAFGRATRIKQRSGAVAGKLGEPERWKMEMAAMLSQAACITLPAETLERLHKGEELTANDEAMMNRLPEIAESLLADIPRIDEVRAILRHQKQPFEGGAVGRESAPLGSRILKTVLDLDALETRGIPPETALEMLRGRAGEYDPGVLLALGSASDAGESIEEIRELPVSELRSGMVLVDPVESTDGRLLVAHGQEVSVGLLERLRNFSENTGVKEPLRVAIRSTAVGRATDSSASEPPADRR